MKRIIFSILAGFFLTAFLSIVTDHIFHVLEVYPPYGQPMLDNGLALLAFTYRALYAIGGAYVTALIAREKAMTSVTILGSIGSFLWLLGAIAMWDYGPVWYNVGGVLLSLPFTLIGGWLYKRKHHPLS